MRQSHWLLGLLAVGTLACVVPFRTAPSAGGALTFAVWGMPFEDRLFEDVYARGFEAKHPGVRVDYERYGNDLTAKYLAWHLLGRGPDVMRVRITDYHAFAARGMLAPLDGFLDDPTIGLSADERADFLPAIWRLLEVDGAIYALPSDNAQYGLYYNKALFDRAGVAYPHPGWSWEDLRRAAQALTVRDEDGRVVQYGLDFELGAWPFMAFLRQAGGALWDDAQTTTLVNSPAGREALAFIVELIPHTAAMRAIGQTGSAAGPDKLFAAGLSAMLLDGSWRAPDLERVAPGLDFAIAPLPRHREAAVVGGSVLWAISAHSDHPELAWRMIKWMTSKAGSLAYWETLRVAPPARLSVMQSDAFRSTPGLVGEDGTLWVHPMPPQRFEDRAAWLLHGVGLDPETGVAPVFVPVAPYQKDLEDAIEAMLKRAVAPRRTEPLETLLARCADAIHEIIDRDRRARRRPALDRR